MAPSKRRTAAPKNEPNSEATRQRILSEARALFGKQGFAKTSTRAIASAANCNISLITYYFGGKEGLLEAVAQNVASGVGTEMGAIAKENLTPQEAVHRMVEFVIDFLNRNSDFLSIIVKVYFAENRPLPPLLVEQMQKNAKSLIALLENLKHRDGMRQELDSSVTATLLMGMSVFQFIAAPVVTKITGPRTPESIALLKRNIEILVLNGIMKTPSPGEKHA